MGLSHKELKELLKYNPATGILTRNVATSSKVKVGDEVGSLEHGYLRGYVNGCRYQIHRLVWFYVYGVMPISNIDHINGNRSDNRIENLRDVSQSCNSKNQKISTKNKSGVIGVCWNKAMGKWRSTIMSDKGVNIHIGYFSDLADATLERLEAELEYGYHKNHGRSI